MNLKLPEVPGPFVAPLTVFLTEDPGTAGLTFTAGAPGSATLALGSPLSLTLELHKTNGAWMQWQVGCAVKVTSPAQNRMFGPSIAIT
ncbi:hypothetical protein [Amycolatopsis sp. lyj-112]|uniref:hypothetical protein n=1 Tax=Amycolatopsis sp. lyj-112 TaxID=2789288 RepID=UPI003979040B